MPIDIKVRVIAVHAFANKIGHPAHSQNVARPIQSEGIAGVEAGSSHHFFVNRAEARVVRLKRMHLGCIRRSHPFDDIKNAFFGPWKLLIHNHAILDLVVLVFGENPSAD